MTFLSTPKRRPSIGAQIAALYQGNASPTDAAPPLPEQPKAPDLPAAPAPVQAQLALVPPTQAANEAPKPPAAPTPAPPAPAPAPKPVTPSQLKSTPPPTPPERPSLPDVVLPIPESIDPVLVRILSWKRPFETVGEINFMTWLHEEIKRRGATPVVKARGCVAVTVPYADGKSATTLFSCHTDTVHWGAALTAQKILYDPNFGEIFLDKTDPDKGSCLGADDGAGVWLLLEMISEKIPGTYLFHRGEERGGVGANAILTADKAWLEQFDCAIAFDRPRNHEVITHQGGQRCASDKFGQALATALNETGVGFQYETSSRGVFTDTKVYRGVIAECVNIGVGYQNQHSEDESLDYGHLVRLRDAVMKLKWDALPIDRDPKAVETYGGYSRGSNYYGSGGGYRGHLHDDDDTTGWYYGGRSASPAPAPAPTSGKGKKGKGKDKNATPTHTPALPTEHELEGFGFDELLAWVEEDPAGATAMLIEMAADISGLKEKIAFLRGALK